MKQCTHTTRYTKRERERWQEKNARDQRIQKCVPNVCRLQDSRFLIVSCTFWGATIRDANSIVSAVWNFSFAAFLPFSSCSLSHFALSISNGKNQQLKLVTCNSNIHCMTLIIFPISLIHPLLSINDRSFIH